MQNDEKVKVVDRRCLDNKVIGQWTKVVFAGLRAALKISVTGPNVVPSLTHDWIFTITRRIHHAICVAADIYDTCSIRTAYNSGGRGQPPLQT